ncbi:MAG: hypothetical protein J2O44_00765 [Porphyrobacter sp.]|nr:hypothetical protein [Porphyrobacter sp.]
MASEPDNKEVIYVPLAGTRSQSIQRLQIGLAGLGAMVLLVGLANIVMDRAKQTEAAAVPEAAAMTGESPTPSVNDPLADAGVAPEMAAKPAPTVTTDASRAPPKR